MPLYNYQCPACSKKEDVFLKLAELETPQYCPYCRTKLQRLISAPMISGFFEPYVSPGTGKIISTPAQRESDLKRSDCFIYEKGVKEDIERNKQRTHEKAFEPIAAGVDEAVRKLVATNQIEG